jgi:hypothetical protein
MKDVFRTGTKIEYADGLGGRNGFARRNILRIPPLPTYPSPNPQEPPAPDPTAAVLALQPVTEHGGSLRALGPHVGNRGFGHRYMDLDLERTGGKNGSLKIGNERHPLG